MSLKLLLFYFIGFIILYLEPVSIGGVTFGILWKLVLMFFITLPILHDSFRKKQIELFVFFSILFAIKTLVSYSSFEYIVTTLTIFIKGLMLPILYLFFINKMKKETLTFIAKHFSILIILSFIPYVLGLIEPLAEGYDLSAYGLDGQYGLIGPFINPHSASISVAFSMIIITFQIKKTNKHLENLFYLLILAFGFYALLLTYVRTGLTIYVLILFYLYLQNINLKKVLLIIMSMFILTAGTIYLFETSEVVRMRLEDKNKYVDKGEVGSGRVTFWKTAVNNWLNDDFSVIFIGLGEEYGKDKMEKVVGLRIFAHNEFFQTLQQEGLIGLIIFLLSLFYLNRFIKNYQKSNYYLVTRVIFLGLITEMMFQGGFYFNIVLLLSIYLALIKKEFLEQTQINMKAYNYVNQNK